MTEPLFTGVGVALATQFDEAGEVDAKATAAHAATLVDLGIRAVVVAGSTGEAATLAAAERVALLTEVRRAVPAGIPVVAGTGAPSARQAAALTRDARDAGADAVLALCPPRSTDPRPYYEAVATAAGDLPTLAYHFPQTAPPGIPVDALPDLPIQGLKDSSADPERLLAELEVFDQPVWVGAAVLLLMAGSLAGGGAGGPAGPSGASGADVAAGVVDNRQPVSGPSATLPEGAPIAAGEAAARPPTGNEAAEAAARPAAGGGADLAAARTRGGAEVGVAGARGVVGAILAVANVDPEHAIAAFAGDPDAQRALFAAHTRVRTAFPHGLKDAIADRFGTSRVTRLG